MYKNKNEVINIKISIGSDHGGFLLKEELVKYLKTTDIVVNDVGTYSLDSVDYPLYAHKVARDVQNKTSDFGILICTSGIGMCISANKHKGIRAAQIHLVSEATSARAHNNSNIICFGAKTMNYDLAVKIIQEFINTPFDGGRHQRRIDIISKQEEEK